MVNTEDKKNQTEKRTHKNNKFRLNTLQRKTFSFVTAASLILPNIFGTGVALADTVEAETEEVTEASDPAEAGVDENLLSEADTSEPELDSDPQPVEEPAAGPEANESTNEPAPAAETPADESVPAPTQVVQPGFTQENLVYENGRIALVNQEPGTNIAAVTPNDTVIFQTVPASGRWEPIQNASWKTVYPGDTLEFFTYSGNERSESTYLTVEGEGEARPADQEGTRYGRQHFNFRPTESSTRIRYSTEPFFTVEMTFPDGSEYTQVADYQGRTSFDFPEGFTPVPGQVFSVQIFDRDGALLDVNNSDLFRNLPSPNQTEIAVDGEVPVPATYNVTINPNGGEIDEESITTEVTEGETFELPYAYQMNLENTGFDLTGYTVEGTLLDSSGNPVTEIERWAGEYTPQSDVTLTANWERTTGDFNLRIYDDERREVEYEGVLTNTETGDSENISLPHLEDTRYAYDNEEMPYGIYTLAIDGYNITAADIRGWREYRQPVMNDDGSATLYLEFQPNYSAAHATVDIQVEPIPEVYDVTIDSGDIPMDEERRVSEVTEGEPFILPFTYQFDFENPGYDLDGFDVEGTLLDAEGNEVTQIPAGSREEYTPLSDVTLTPNWSVTTGSFTISIGNTDVEPEEYTVELTAEDGTAYELPYLNTTTSSNGPISHNYVDEAFPYGTYTLSIDGYEITEADIRGWQMRTQPELNDDGTATVFLQFPENYPRNHATLDLEVEQEPAFPIGIEVRGLDNLRTDDVTIWIQNEDFTVFEGSFNEYDQWRTEEELPVGEYTITLDTPENTYAVINETTTNYAILTDQQNVFTIEVNEENRGSMSAVFAAFRLEEMEFPLGVEVRGLDGRRTDDVEVTVSDDDGEVFAGSFNDYGQWLTEEGLPAGEYTITLDTPEDTVAVINEDVQQFAEATDEDNVFRIELNESNLGTSSAIYGAFRLQEVEDETIPLGIIVQDLDGRRTSRVRVRVTDEDGEQVEGEFNEYGQWISEEPLPVGRYRIALRTPEGTHAIINEDVEQGTQNTRRENVFSIYVHEDNMFYTSRVYSTFRLVEDEGDEDDTDDVLRRLLQRINELENRLEDLEEVNEGLQEELEQLRALFAALQAEQDAAQEEIDELEDRIAELERRIEELEDEDDADAPEDSNDDNEDNGDDNNDDAPVDDEDNDSFGENDAEDVAVEAGDNDSDNLPQTGAASAPIGLGIATLLSGLGLAFFDKKRKK